MACKTVCRLCDKLVISQSVTFTGGNVVVNVPAGTYGNNCKYCIVIAQNIPTTATITAPVMITIGDGAELYPLTTCDCAQVTACGIRKRTRYKVQVSTSATSGAFRMLGRPCCSPDNSLDGISGTAPAAPANV